MTAYAYYDTELGLLMVACENDAVSCLQFADRRDHPDDPTPLSDQAAEQVRAYLTGGRKAFDLPLVLRGTDFQRAVWEQVRGIPYGQTRTYGEIAAGLDRPGSARAVGTAVARNPVWLAVPCHRVVGKDGRLTGYAGGLERKAFLLALEKAAPDEKEVSREEKL